MYKLFKTLYIDNKVLQHTHLGGYNFKPIKILTYEDYPQDKQLIYGCFMHFSRKKEIGTTIFFCLLTFSQTARPRFFTR